MQVGGQATEVAEAIKKLQGSHSSFQTQGKADDVLSITLVLNPLSKTAQQLSNTLDFLRRVLQPTIKVRTSALEVRIGLMRAEMH